MKIVRGWIDCAGKCRTWNLLDEDGTKIAEFTTKRGAEEVLRRLTQR